MVLILIFAAAGCGKSDNGGSGSGAGTQNQTGTDAGSSSASGTEVNTGSDSGSGTGSTVQRTGSGEYLGKASVDIRRVDDGSLLFTLTGDAVTYLNNDMDSSDTIMVEFSHEGGSEPDATAQFQHTQWFFCSAGAVYSTNDWTGGYGSGNKYVAQVAGASEYVPDDDNYRIFYFKDGYWNYDDGFIAEGKVSSVLSGSVSVADAAKLLPEYRPENTANNSWVGSYITSKYNNDQGYVKIAMNESGALDVSGVHNGTEFSFTAEEKEGEELKYDYGTCFTGRAEGVKLGDNRYAAMDISIDYDGSGSLNVSYSDYSDGEGVSVYGNYQVFKGFDKPAGYNDEDKYGKVLAKHDGDAQYFVPATDNYGIVYDNSNIATVYKDADYNTYEQYHYDSYSLYSFDINDCQIDYKLKYVFDTEDAAKQVFDYWMDNWYDPEKTFRVGKAIYMPFEYCSTGTSKLSACGLSSMTWYVGCNYAYDRWNDADSIRYSYLSQPMKAENCKYGVEEALFWTKVPDGTHRSIDDPDSSFSYYNYDGELPAISISSSDIYYTSLNYSSTRFYGTSAVTMDYSESYWDDTAPDTIIVTEFEFGEEEATVTQYVYEASIRKMELTFDNYRTLTPKQTKTHRFDMLHVVNY